MSVSTQKIPLSHPRNSSYESELVVRAQRGDNVAFGLLYERYYHQLYSYITCMVGDKEVGKDLTQEAFIKAWKGLSGLRDTSKFLDWLYRITTNVAYDHLRRSKLVRWLSWEHGNEQEISRETSSAGLEIQIEEHELLIMALSRVSPTYRPCLILYYVEKLKQNDIAKILHMKEGNVAKYVSRGLAELRREYTRLSLEHSNPTEKGREAE